MKKLLDEDITEKVEDFPHFEYLTQSLPIKGIQELSDCVDMREANKAIQ